MNQAWCVKNKNATVVGRNLPLRTLIIKPFQQCIIITIAVLQDGFYIFTIKYFFLRTYLSSKLENPMPKIELEEQLEKGGKYINQ